MGTRSSVAGIEWDNRFKFDDELCNFHPPGQFI